MPRNGAGTFSVENPIVVGALRSSSAVNTNFTDMGDEITNSLPINGEAGMSGQFKAIDGTALAPGIAFADDPNLGFRRSTSDEMKWVGGGSDRATMDANGKLTLAGGLSVAGALTHSTGVFGNQTLAGSGAARATLRRTENDTVERELATYQSGLGAGAKGSLRQVGGGTNDVQTMRFYINDVLTFQWTGTLFTHEIDTLFGGASGIRADTDGYVDFTEVTAPSSPSINQARIYVRDASGTTGLYYKDDAGVERSFQPSVDRQVFSVSGSWVRPTQGQTTAKIEIWGGGGGGGDSPTIGSGGGGGAYVSKIISLASLSASVSVVVGSGGQLDSAGGDSSFGTYLTGYGGGGGDGGNVGDGGGGGGGPQSAGTTASGTVSGAGGLPHGLLAGSEWGARGGDDAANSFGGGGGSEDNASAGCSFWGGGGGSGVGNDSTTIAGSSIFGGGGGEGSFGLAAGASINGGAGGATGVAGSAPGGGGGFTAVGARGEVRITCW